MNTPLTLLSPPQGPSLVGQLAPFQLGFGPWTLHELRIRTAQGWQTLDQARLLEQNPTQLRLELSAGGLVVPLEVRWQQGQLHLSLQAPASQVDWVACDLAANPTEHFMGFGENFGSLDQRGNQVDLYVENGAIANSCYKPIPFYVSSAGYGLRLATDLRAQVRAATPDHPQVVSLRAEGNELRLEVYLGQPLQVIEQYTGRVGRPALPPAWVFGPWKSRDWTVENQATVLEDVRLGRQLELAGSVKLIDALWEPAEHTFTFSPQRYPDPQAMIGELRREGYRLVLWLSPWVVYNDPPSEIYQFCDQQGFLIRNPQGQTYIHRLGNSPTFMGSCLDFTNPAAVAWWQERVRQTVRLGVDGFKTDFGEQVPPDAVFWDGRTGRELHNIFPRIYNQITYQAMQQETDGVLLARSAWEGSQGISAIWAGDQTSDMTPWSGLPSVIRAAQSAAISGFPYWASDIGGYFGVPTDEVFIRWSQFAAFSPIMQIHGMGNREPWNFAPQTLEIYRRYARLHTDLFPYIYTYAQQAAQLGRPMVRAMALEFGHDPQVWNDLVEHQYFLGHELLVAPAYSGTRDGRHVYLPQGNWCSFWDGTPYAGGRWLAVEAPLESIPVMVRAGSLVPMLLHPAATLDPAPEAVEYRQQASPDLLLRVYPGASGQFELYDGSRFSWDQDTRTLHIWSAVERRLEAWCLDRPQSDALPYLNLGAGQSGQLRLG